MNSICEIAEFAERVAQQWGRMSSYLKMVTKDYLPITPSEKAAWMNGFMRGQEGVYEDAGEQLSGIADILKTFITEPVSERTEED